MSRLDWRSNHRWSGDLEVIRVCARCGAEIAPEPREGGDPEKCRRWLVRMPGQKIWKNYGQGGKGYKPLPLCIPPQLDLGLGDEA